MNAIDTYLPWSGVSVRMLPDLNSYFGNLIGDCAEEYLPRTISLFFDEQITESELKNFLDGATAQLAKELRVRTARCSRFMKVCGISSDELRTFLTARTDAQPWALYYSHTGGLGPLQDGVSGDQHRGVVPCSTMRNHGVAWENSHGDLRVWLATSPKENCDWDWDSDIGHESAHAAFAPVPLFVQGEAVSLSCVRSAHDLEPNHVARMCYLFSEIAVVAIRGETRETETRLPVAERDELFALLSLSDALAPGAGFRAALDAASRVDGVVNPNDGDTVFEIAQPIIRLLPCLRGLTKAFHPPAKSQFTALASKFNNVANAELARIG